MNLMLSLSETSKERSPCSHVLVGKFPWLCESRDTFSAASNSNFAFECLWNLEDTLLGLTGQESALGSRACFAMGEFLPAGLFLHVVLIDLVCSLLLLNGLNFSLLCLLHFICICLRDRETLRHLVTSRCCDLLDCSLLGCTLGATQSDLVKLYLILASIFCERDFVTLLGLLRDDTVVPQAILSEDSLAISAWLALCWVRWSQHLHIGNLVLPTLVEADEVYHASFDPSVVSAHRFDRAIVPLLLEECLASPADKSGVH